MKSLIDKLNNLPKFLIWVIVIIGLIFAAFAIEAFKELIGLDNSWYEPRE